MKHIFNKYLSAVAIAYLFITLISDFFNLIIYNVNFSSLHFELVVYLIIAVTLDAILYHVVFTRFLTHFLIETMLLYPVTLAFAYFGHWFLFHIGNLITNSLIYLSIISIIHIYFYHMAKEEAKEMNKLLDSLNN
ncbi:DUF3021 family protein [Anaerocolumna sp. MB42-C2]|uniref:DUF3021 family protein n=1 Tax=Anaerocolumna sp. MB42-C2 TaxID=3070997 RepID=UPI0027E03670|nr:DUF3021 family protein [Anaerocolumna sp. MB42-C2]WMJ88011.1 hypothetical protein RBU59_00470 [Anaerocolumna sp. MB42-C2]